MIKKILFILIMLLAIGLRFAFLTNVPPSASLDEATIGWNAYSLLHTGRDEYGYFLPILLRAYDDYRPALYVYLTIPFVKLLGLRVLSVRLPSVIMSVATVAMAFFLTKNIFFTFKKKETLAFLVMLLLAISPWHVYLSRLGHEVNLGLTLIVAALLLFFVGINKKNGWFIIFSLITFSLSFYSYQSEKVFTPLLVVSLVALFWKELYALRRYVITGFILFAAITLPIFIISLSPQSLIRLKGTSIFTDNPKYQQAAQQIVLDKQKGNIFGEIINNRRIITAAIFAQNYFSHFNPYWLFGNTGDELFKAPYTGLLYVWEAPFLYIGLFYFLLSQKFTKKMKAFLVLWIFIDFLAPGITTQAPHAMRAYTLLPVPQILTALGVLFILGILQKHSKNISLGFIVLLSVIAMQSLIAFINNYFVVFPFRQSQEFQYALASAIPYIQQNKNLYTHIVVSKRKNLRDSYMLYLFYSTYSPQKYLAAGGTKDGGFAADHTIGNITFRQIDWSKDSTSHALFVGNPTDFPKNIKPIMTFYYLNGKPGVILVQN